MSDTATIIRPPLQEKCQAIEQVPRRGTRMVREFSVSNARTFDAWESCLPLKAFMPDFNRRPDLDSLRKILQWFSLLLRQPAIERMDSTAVFETGRLWDEQMNGESADAIMEGYSLLLIDSDDTHLDYVNFSACDSPQATQADVDIAKTPQFTIRSESTQEFIHKHQLDQSIEWLQNQVGKHFPGASFELYLDFCEDDEEQGLALIVYAQFEARDFLRRHENLIDAMLDAGQDQLFMKLGVFQRSAERHGRDGVS